MPEEILIELSGQPIKKPFFKTVTGIIILAAIFIVILAALFSWWLATGKISSAAARLDTMIYTVGSDFPARLKSVYVLAGDQVTKGQPLGTIESPEYAGQLQSAADELANLRSLAGLPQAQNQKDSATLVEKEAASKLAQARFEEERLQKIYQETVTEHVRAQLALRALPVSRQVEYNQAQLNEARAKAKMTEALESFEKASKFRATLDQALAKIKMAIIAARRSAGLDSAPAAAGASQQASFAGESVLSSPAQGSVFRISAQPGQIIEPGETVFYILPTQGQESGDRWIQAWFSPADKDNIKIGQPVSIKFPGLDLIVYGKVEVIAENEESLPDTLAPDTHAAAFSRPSGTYLKGLYIPVKIALDEPDQIRDLEPGAQADCQIQSHYILGTGWF